ncbi:hypothetical protein Tco_0328928 [Tanacetum coccineum]
MGNHVKVELPSDWCYDKFRGYGTCVVFKRKIPRESIGYSIKNFDGSSLGGCFPHHYEESLKRKPIIINESYMIWLHYTWNTSEWKEAKNVVTFCLDEDNDVEVKEFGARLICDGDLEQDVTNSIITWWGHERPTLVVVHPLPMRLEPLALIPWLGVQANRRPPVR